MDPEKQPLIKHTGGLVRVRRAIVADAAAIHKLDQRQAALLSHRVPYEVRVRSIGPITEAVTRWRHSERCAWFVAEATDEKTSSNPRLLASIVIVPHEYTIPGEGRGYPKVAVLWFTPPAWQELDSDPERKAEGVLLNAGVTWARECAWYNSIIARMVFRDGSAERVQFVDTLRSFGFVEAGRLKGVLEKDGSDWDETVMQLALRSREQDLMTD